MCKAGGACDEYCGDREEGKEEDGREHAFERDML